MKLERFAVLLTLACFLLPGMAVAESCCDKAKAKGETCQHKCCVAAAELRTICFKCNPDKAKSCCDKALAKGGECQHKCCVAARKNFFICTRCNPGRTVALFTGKLDGWVAKGKSGHNKWTIGEPSCKPTESRLTVKKSGKALVNHLAGDHGRDLYSVAQFGDALIEVEVMVPKNSNSGIYVMGEYEIQVLDSYGKKNLGQGDMGAVYGAAPPPVNASKPPGQWQKYVIDFRAPRFNDKGEKVENARLLKVELNGKVLHKNLELKQQTPGGVKNTEAPVGPLMFQGNHGEVAYRNIFVTPK